MSEQIDRVRAGLDVISRDGEPIGTIDRLYRPTDGEFELADLIVHVETGLFGLGEGLYVPGGAVTRVDDDGVHLNVDRDHIDTRGWDTRPDGLSAYHRA